MLADEWEDIKQIFESASKLAGAERSKWLDAACRDKPVIRQTVEELLKADTEAGDFLEDDIAAEAEAVFQPGDLIGDRFRIIRFISRGGMGEVYEALDERLSLRVALKTLRFEYAQERDALERFRREIRVSRDFGHPNLCRMYELVEHRLAPAAPGSDPQVVTCLTMQLIGGETLQQYLAKKAPLPLEDALPLITQIAAAVEVLHSNGIVHRDLKPSNIMVTPGVGGAPRAIVMDFGLAKPLQTPKDLFHSHTDFQAGAPFYLAPELLRGEKPSAASDIYALGLIADEMVTSSRPYSGDTVEEILRQKLWGDPIDPEKRAVGLPHAWSLAILRCLSRNSDRRFATAGDFVAALEIEQKKGAHRQSRIRKAVSRRLRQARFEIPRRIARRKTLSIMLLLSVVTVVCVAALVHPKPLTTSVLVFPFENGTGDSSYDFFCKGVTDEVTRRLLDLQSLDVIPYYEPHSAVRAFRPSTTFSIDGYLQAHMGASRLTVELTENSSRRVVWIKRFDRSLAQPLDVEDEVAGGAVEAMRSYLFAGRERSQSAALLLPVATLFRHLLAPHIDQPGQPATPNAAAMEAYMRGNTLFLDATAPSLEKATVEYRKALSEDPHFALAYADLSAVDLQLIQFDFEPTPQLLNEAQRYATLAVKSGPDFAEAHTSLAAVRQYQWDWKDAENEYLRAIRANPKFARAHRWYAGFLIQFGRNDDAFKEARQSIALDPYDYAGRMSLGTYLYYAGRFQEGIDSVEGTLREKNLPVGHEILGNLYAALAANSQGTQRAEYLDRALRETALVAQADREAAITDSPGESTPMYALIYALRGDRGTAKKYLDKLLAGARENKVAAEDLANAYVALGEYKAALSLLRAGVNKKDNGLLYFKVDPFLAPLHNNPEFTSLVQKAKL